ncbi:MAG: RagB/SusD family nutrient uptake outer membrane protein [Candidatus Pseudobacter hemicellulosilyticus]|uniref:RagB/SusD family nutrient uptake outer membrane protein n=1 Tax=Candidatus Pseudobacter hemicellulosilyticus TaxID=3121375 RepID=A0AAJ5WNJ0_9BACT|nr:MAG: RagB/SusD family nutrient uptake outer membrane protein [Pseudobacter sp.]
MLYFFCCCLLLSACDKEEEWLDVKRQSTDVTPASMKDMEALLNNTYVFNAGYAVLGLCGSDNIILTDDNLAAASEQDRRLYLWDPNPYITDKGVLDYLNQYNRVRYANLVLEGLDKLGTASDPAQGSRFQAEALFFRAMTYYNLSQTYCVPYAPDKLSAPGLVLRTGSDPNIVNQRSSIQDTYDNILQDFRQAAAVLPRNGKYSSSPSRPAAHAFLAKVFLSMELYDSAWYHADKALAEYSTLLDYNDPVLVNPSSSFRFPAFSSDASLNNPEIIFFASSGSTAITWPFYGIQYAHPALYASYGTDDLRRTLIYQDLGAGRVQFWGAYAGTYYNFSGIASNELFLIRAETAARAGRTTDAMSDLNTLLRKRYRTGTYTDRAAASAEDALQQVLTERRKELPFTGQLAWEDLRRLNKDPRFARTLTRVQNGITYELPPGDKRYTFLIPPAEVAAGVQQNER